MRHYPVRDVLPQVKFAIRNRKVASVNESRIIQRLKQVLNPALPSQFTPITTKNSWNSWEII